MINLGDCRQDATFKVNVGHDRGRATRVCNDHLPKTLEKAVRKSKKAVVFNVDNQLESSPARCEYGGDIWKEIL